jgi:Cu(I)/Ag(I) efflux system membrane protein CusA/SilA
VTTNLQGLAGVRAVRSQSAFGFSMVYVVFEDDVDLYFARARVLERMSLMAKMLPPGVVPTLGPDATGVGHVFWYTVESPTRSLRELRTLQDWFIRYQLNAVPGVAEVASVGGFVQQYQIDVDPNRLRSYNLPLSAVVNAVRESNLNVGGNVLESNGAWLIVRGVGLIQSVEDVRRIPITASAGVPVYVEQVADVHIGEAFRVASLVKGTTEAVGGVVVARTGVNTKALIDAVKARIAQIQPGLPPDVQIVPFYDRSDLIEQSTDTLRRALVEEIALVTLAHIVFLMHVRSILIVTAPLPLAVLLSFLGMYYAGISSNIMSLAGIAIAIGVLVDAGIVVTENAFRFLEQRKVDPHDRALVWSTVLDGDHPPRLRAGLRVNGAGGQALPSAGFHQDARRAGGDVDCRDARARALHGPSGREVSRGGRQSGHAGPPAALSARIGGSSHASRGHDRVGRGTLRRRRVGRARHRQ